MATSDLKTEYEYVVVGSGAGGGTVAARLAEAGRTVLLLEAGNDPVHSHGGDAIGKDRLPEDYHVPAFHTFASENETMKWDFWVRHYGDDVQQRKDPKYYPEYEGRPVDGVWYPRAGTLGGCTAHNAMIVLYPDNSEWERIARITGDESWAPTRMRKYFERMENCHHRTPYRWLQKLTGWNPTRHGFGGWLDTEVSIPKSAIGDEDLVKVVKKSARSAFKELRHPLKRLDWLLHSQGDPNDWRLAKDDAVGIRAVPLSTRNHARVGSREFVRETAEKYPDRLKIELDALATRVRFDKQNRAVGVDYLKGERLYRADAKPSADPGQKRTVRASREVILAGGAFNTPQLLMLSGIGPRNELERHGIEVLVDLPGVGRNLQDRYEVGVVYRMKELWEVLEGAQFAKGDPIYKRWRAGKGVYTSNGAVLSVIKKSKKRTPPDLFLFALLGLFRGYFPNYSALLAENLNYLTWAILKGHTHNTCGTVTLRSSDPRETPHINFKYFEEGSSGYKEDLDAIVQAIQFVRKMTSKIELIEREELPGEHVQTPADLGRFVKDHAWGHHASCTCPIGPREEGGVLNGNFEVHGTRNLRVVDASVFPRIPGLFIVSSIYMVAEKASDVILADALKR